MAGASPDAPAYKMKMKIYTTGQIAKKYHINLKQVTDWYKKLISSKHIVSLRNPGTVKITGDPHGRYGLPSSLVKHFPNTPPKNS